LASDALLGGAPAGIVLLVGGPGSGKGVLSRRLEEECGVVHLSSGDLLRDEVRRDTILGREVKEVMARGELVSSVVIVKLIRRVMRTHAPGKRVLLDGFPRSLQNAEDLVELCGIPELAIHLNCEDTTMMERILKRKDEAVAAVENAKDGDSTTVRADDNIHTALQRLRAYHKSQKTTMDWLHEQHVPIINLDGSGTPDQVWGQLLAIGRLMRPACTIDPRPLPRGSS
jgi:adenylate kinase